MLLMLFLQEGGLTSVTGINATEIDPAAVAVRHRGVEVGVDVERSTNDIDLTPVHPLPHFPPQVIHRNQTAHQAEVKKSRAYYSGGIRSPDFCNSRAEVTYISWSNCLKMLI